MEEASMHALQAIAVVAVLAIGLGAKLVVLPVSKPDLNTSVVQNASVNALQANFNHQNTSSLPVEKIHDMTFVYPEKE
jgi:hypothetical protein